MYDGAVNDGKIKDLNKEDRLHLRNGLVDNTNNDDDDNNYIKQGGVIYQQDGQENHFVGANNNPQAQYEYFGGVNELDKNNINKRKEHGKVGNEIQNQGGNNSNHAKISDNEGSLYDPEDNKDDSDGKWCFTLYRPESVFPL